MYSSRNTMWAIPCDCSGNQKRRTSQLQTRRRHGARGKWTPFNCNFSPRMKKRKRVTLSSITGECVTSVSSGSDINPISRRSAAQ